MGTILRKLWMPRIPCSSCIPPDRPGNQKGWCIPQEDIWSIPPIRLRTYSNIERMIFIGVPQTLDGLLGTPISFMAPWPMALRPLCLKAYPHILILVGFGKSVEKHQITQFYTAPTAIRALAKENLDYVNKHDLSCLKVLGTVGEPINEEAWHWYNDHVGEKKCPIVDTWWQTETGGILISPIPFATPTKPTYATLPMPGVQPALMDENGSEIKGNQMDGRLCIKFPWPSMARSIWGNHQRYKNTYFSAFKDMYFTGDGALRDEVGYYRITGRVDDVIIVSGHNLGTAPIEDAINEHPAVAESAIVGYPHDIKGNALYGYVILKETGESRDRDNLKKEINQVITEHIGPIAKLNKIQFVPGLPKTRSGKIMRRILRKIASKDTKNLGDTSTLLNPEVVEKIMEEAL